MHFQLSHTPLVWRGIASPLCIALMLCVLLQNVAWAQARSQKDRGWSQAIEQALTEARSNRKEIEAALRAAPSAQREGLQFLIENMPAQDLQTLSAKYLLENVALAYAGYSTAPWKARIPKAIFFNDILPYACLNEARDDSRKMLREKTAPLIADCKTPGEAAQRLNQKIFPLFNARYSTERKRPDQSPLETIASGKATCTGLSILLVEACRACGIPARVVGTPLWTNNTGNHTWVEIWDGDWHYVGAAEPDPAGLDHGWFAGNASQAQRDVPEHAIYASSFAQTGVAFPLVWAPENKTVPAVNVTDRYAAKTPVADSGKAHLLVRVLDPNGKRIPAHVALREVGKSAVLLEGTSKGETADINDMLTFQVYRTCPPLRYEITAEYSGQTARSVVNSGMEAQQIVTIRLLANAQNRLANLLADRFGVDAAKQAVARQQLASLPANAQARDLAWTAYKASPALESLRPDFEKKMVSTSDRTSPYLWRHVGDRPADGWALVIAMHGGGGAPKAVNDNEWRYMFEHYYKEHPEAGGYVYLALRAPNDAWNGFYDDSISPLVEKLIQQFVLFDDVNPDKVYALGASHGGYGAFVIGPKIPYRFSAIHAAASAPTDGETMGENLRNTVFTFIVGETDTDYGRMERCRKFEKQVETWRKQYGGFEGEFKCPTGIGHLVPDHDELATLLKSPKRNAWPKCVLWVQSDNVLKRFYWLEAIHPINQGRIEAQVEGNTITLKAEKQDSVALWLDTNLVDLNKPVDVVVMGGKKQVFKVKPNLETYCEGLESAADPHLAAPVRILVSLTPQN